jgi:hypothetical protein
VSNGVENVITTHPPQQGAHTWLHAIEKKLERGINKKYINYKCNPAGILFLP